MFTIMRHFRMQKKSPVVPPVLRQRLIAELDRTTGAVFIIVQRQCFA